jgi:ATP-dependent phosphofructokinase / diphosphate-dependent phosphofructokinase
MTGGGDCPGLNAVIRAIVRKGRRSYDDTFVGFRNGWRGALDDVWIELTIDNTRGMLHRGGTILGTSRDTPLREPEGVDRLRDTMARQSVDAIIAIGGDGTLSVARILSDQGIPIVGVPKTIDNDIDATDVTFGFHTAVQIATDAIDRLHTTAESHDRVMIVEVMGRNTGWIALYAGMGGGADVILVPERPFDIDEVCARLRQRHARASFSIVVVAEGAFPAAGTIDAPDYALDEAGRPRLGGISNLVRREIEERTGFESRVTILGHVQRGGTPCAHDRVLATRLGVAAIEAVHDGRLGTMPALRGTQIELVTLHEATDRQKTIDPALYETAEVFFG